MPGDERGKLVGPALEDAILDLAPEDLHRVFAVVVTSGTTNCGIVDDLKSVRGEHSRMHHAQQCVVCQNWRTSISYPTGVQTSRACARHGWWMHVDGAYGGAGVFAPSVRKLYKGLACADRWVDLDTSACGFRVSVSASLSKHAFGLLFFVHNVRMCEFSASRWTRTNGSLAASTAAPSCTCLEFTMTWVICATSHCALFANGTLEGAMLLKFLSRVACVHTVIATPPSPAWPTPSTHHT